MEAAFLFQWNLFYGTVCDVNEAVLLQSAEKLIHILFFTLQLHFHTAVVQIRDPAGQSQTLGEIVCPVTKAHALDTAAYENVLSDHFSFFHLITFILLLETIDPVNDYNFFPLFLQLIHQFS